MIAKDRLRGRGGRGLRILLFATLLVASCSGARAEDARLFLRGVTISAQTDGREWATPQMAAALDEVKSLGANAIAIHPYASVQADGSLRFSSDPEPEMLVKPLEWARARGLRVMLVPHIAYWGSPWLWRGEIEFDTPEKTRRFFHDYERWITLMARIAQAHGAEIFCIGLEFEKLEKYSARWLQIIAAVRREFHGKLTYGANWDDVGNVPFWDALDLIGVLAYFPLTSAPNPTPEQIAAGWEPWMVKLRALSMRHRKPVLFTEIGYNENERAAAEPWDFHRKGNADAAGVQARCFEQALRLEGRYPFLAGMFWWKWFPDLPMPEGVTFDIRKPALKKLLRRYWLAPTGGK